MKVRLIGFIMMIALALVACETGDSATDALSAQNQQPAITGYQTTDLDVAGDAILATAAGSAVATGNVPLVAAIQRGDALLQCLQDTGAMSGLVYVEQNPNIVPQVGTSLIINRTRVASNVFNCLTDLTSAQSINLEPCSAYGEFTVESEEFYFAYVGAGDGICAAFQSHYQSLNATVLGAYPAP